MKSVRSQSAYARQWVSAPARGFLGGMALLWAAVACDSAQTLVAHDPVSTTPRVISLDYCADQYVLRFVPRSHIVAVSPDARKYFSYMRDAHRDVPSVSPAAEDVLVYQPTVVVRSYGGGPRARTFFERAGVRVVQLGYPTSLAQVRAQIVEIAGQLGSRAQGEQVANRFDQRLQTLRRRQHAPSALYTTPGGVTTGPGSLVHKMMLEAGLANYEQRAGWRDLPLERLVVDKPGMLAVATFGDAGSHVDPWTRSRHPHVRALSQQLPSVQFEGAWTSCGGWFLVDAIEAMSQDTVRPDAGHRPTGDAP